jgi:hypothetical protein
VESLAGRDRHEHGPQVFSIRQIGEVSMLGTAAETVESTESHVFLIGRPSRGVAKLGTGQAH